MAEKAAKMCNAYCSNTFFFLSPSPSLSRSLARPPPALSSASAGRCGDSAGGKRRLQLALSGWTPSRLASFVCVWPILRCRHSLQKRTRHTYPRHTFLSAWTGLFGLGISASS